MAGVCGARADADGLLAQDSEASSSPRLLPPPPSWRKPP